MSAGKRLKFWSAALMWVFVGVFSFMTITDHRNGNPAFEYALSKLIHTTKLILFEALYPPRDLRIAAQLEVVASIDAMELRHVEAEARLWRAIRIYQSKKNQER